MRKIILMVCFAILAGNFAYAEITTADGWSVTKTISLWADRDYRALAVKQDVNGNAAEIYTAIGYGSNSYLLKTDADTGTVSGVGTLTGTPYISDMAFGYNNGVSDVLYAASLYAGTNARGIYTVDTSTAAMALQGDTSSYQDITSMSITRDASGNTANIYYTLYGYSPLKSYDIAAGTSSDVVGNKNYTINTAFDSLSGDMATDDNMIIQEDTYKHITKWSYTGGWDQYLYTNVNTVEDPAATSDIEFAWDEDGTTSDFVMLAWDTKIVMGDPDETDPASLASKPILASGFSNVSKIFGTYDGSVWVLDDGADKLYQISQVPEPTMMGVLVLGLILTKKSRSKRA